MTTPSMFDEEVARRAAAEKLNETLLAEHKAMDAELLARAKHIHDLNCRLGRGDTAQAREAALAQRVTALESYQRDLIVRHKQDLAAAKQDLAAANARIDELLASEPDEDVPGVYIEDEIEALTDVIRAAKAIRKRWRAGVEG